MLRDRLCSRQGHIVNMLRFARTRTIICVIRQNNFIWQGQKIIPCVAFEPKNLERSGSSAFKGLQKYCHLLVQGIRQCQTPNHQNNNFSPSTNGYFATTAGNGRTVRHSTPYPTTPQCTFPTFGWKMGSLFDLSDNLPRESCLYLIHSKFGLVHAYAKATGGNSAFASGTGWTW